MILKIGKGTKNVWFGLGVEYCSSGTQEKQ